MKGTFPTRGLVLLLLTTNVSEKLYLVRERSMRKVVIVLIQ